MKLTSVERIGLEIHPFMPSRVASGSPGRRAARPNPGGEGGEAAAGRDGVSPAVRLYGSLSVVRVLTGLSELGLGGLGDEMLVHGLKQTAFAVSDVDATARRLTSQDVRFVVEPFDDSQMKLRSFIVADPDDILVQFVQEVR